MAINPLDPNLEDKLDRYIETQYWFERAFKSKFISAVIIDPKEEFPLKGYADSRFGEMFIKYFDLSECKEGDYRLIAKFIVQYVADGESMIDGLIFDNIDRIPEISDKEEIEQMVLYALKRDDDWRPVIPGPTIPFSKMMIASRCKEFPAYLLGKSLQANAIEMK